ncbi:MAG: hypothetical protein AAGD38_13560 [Acidobacteriota bacterium]
MKKKTAFMLTLAAFALAAMALVPAATADLYGGAADGVFSDSVMTEGYCEKQVCIDGLKCKDTTARLGCRVIGDGCNTYECDGDAIGTDKE